MSKGNSVERIKMIRAFGAELVLVDQAPGSVPGQVSGDDLALIMQKTEELTKELGAFRADQFNNPANVAAHIKTGKQFFEQCGGDIDAFVDFIGSAGTFMGCAKTFERYFDILTQITKLSSSLTCDIN